MHFLRYVYVAKPEPIILLVLPIIPLRISHVHVAIITEFNV